MKRVLSGIQPTGTLHIGNYLGAVKNWVHLAKTVPEPYFSVVDMHAISSSYFQAAQGITGAKELRASVLKTTATLVACGLPRETVFVQSQVPEHAELFWILGCFTPMSWLQRMTQFKEKKDALGGASLGLYSYPVLMAADILLYKAEGVPVGQDQTQHLEISSDLALRLNSMFNMRLPIPAPLLTSFPKVYSLRDGLVKMSKSSGNDNTRINLLDSPVDISLKISKAKTDPELQVYSSESRPELTNLMLIYGALKNRSLEEVNTEFKGLTIIHFKEALFQALLSTLKPIREHAERLLANPEELNAGLRESRDRARALASETLSEIKRAVGFS
mmetsp:Transcript_13027/g.24241  ORF Transcript_13027/g.24241 Transcript_13027/m.24241 type:complete len:332 (-) Transcript_13027:102-1097(-)